MNILLVGSQTFDDAEIRRELAATANFACTAYYVADPDEALEFIRRNEVQIKIIFIDLSHFNARYPKEHFLRLRLGIPDVPIVVLTDRDDADLQHFVMEQGAADNVSQWQLRNDPGRLHNILESSLSRDKLMRREREQNAEDVDISGAQGDAALKAERGRSDAALKKAVQASDASLQDAQDINAQLRREVAELRREKSAPAERKKDPHRENDDANGALSGGCSGQPPSDNGKGANENETPA